MTTADLLDRSAAAASFREALTQFLRDGRPSQRIAYGHGCPPIKVQRTLHKLLVEYPDLPIESIEMQAASGCEYFRGRMIVRTQGEERRVQFHWDCKWRADREGWRDWFGFPDQTRAAREFGWDCFRTWSEEEVIALPGIRVVSADEAEAVPRDGLIRRTASTRTDRPGADGRSPRGSGRSSFAPLPAAEPVTDGRGIPFQDTCAATVSARIKHSPTFILR